MENASKFTPPEGKIELGAKRDGEWLQMWVQDNGPGIPFADQEKIFEKFTRLKAEGSANRPGSWPGFLQVGSGRSRRKNLGREPSQYLRLKGYAKISASDSCRH